MSTNSYRKCSKCGITPHQDKSVSYHRFPNPGKTNVLKAKAWAKYCWPDKESWSIESLRQLFTSNKVLCNRHFEDSCFMESSRKKLSIFSVPGDKQYVTDLMASLRKEESNTSEQTSEECNHFGSSCSVIKCWKWDVPKIIKQYNNNKYGLIVLNNPITQKQDFIKDFWKSATVRVTVDGGTYYWDIFLKKFSKEAQQSIELPSLITGDFDSVPQDILQKYKTKGCKIIHTPDQNYTDFTKALMVLNIHCQENNIELNEVIVICQNSGRIDQIMGNVQTLFLNETRRLLNPNIRLFLMADDSLSWLLYPGDHLIHIPEESIKHEGAWCSLVPVGETCTEITTHGLKWDLDKRRLKFGELVSTSNTFNGQKTVTVKCSHHVLWSMIVPSLTNKFSKSDDDCH